jgi:hypothetical protein
MNRLVFSVLLSILSLSTIATAGEPSLAKLAEQRVPETFATVVAETQKFSDSTLPYDAKTYRKQIVAARDLIDLFTHVYPAGDKVDLWNEIRNDLDTGYEAVGQFKDLFDSQGVEPSEAVYDKEELKETRAVVLKWKKSFLKNVQKHDYQGYLAAPLANQFEFRSKKDLSRFYWGAVDLSPELGASGPANLKSLVSALLLAAADDYESVMKISDLLKGDNDIAFHDFRKRVRSITKTCHYFPSLMPASAQSKQVLASLTEIVDAYGMINDDIVRYHRAEEHKKKKTMSALNKKIRNDWEALREKQDDMNVDEILSAASEMIDQ